MAGLVLVAVIGFAFYQSLTLLERLILPWQRPSTFIESDTEQSQTS